MTKAKTPFYQQFAEAIIDKLEKGTAPWQRPWEAGEFQPAFNPVSGIVYKGVNQVMLGSDGLNDPRFMTYKQAESQGWQVRKGSKSQTLVFWQSAAINVVKDEDGKPVRDEDGNVKTQRVERAKPVLRFFNVFHASQIDGIPEWDGREITWNPDKRAEAILENSGADIIHDQRDKAYYTMIKDEIHMPSRAAFEDSDKYYGTVLHELGHWTRHPDRLDRENGPFGSEMYAKEELRAEIASWMITSELGLSHDPSRHLSYVDSWVKVLKEDPYEIVRACQSADKIKNYTLAFEQQQVLEQTKAKIPFEREKSSFIGIANEENIVLLNVPFSERNEAKKNGAMWDPQHKTWFTLRYDKEIPLQEDLKELSRWLPDQQVSENVKVMEGQNKESGIAMSAQDKAKLERRESMYGVREEGKTWLKVPFSEKDEAKQLGAKWDKKQKMWFAPEGTDLKPLSQWLPGQEAAMEQAEALQQTGVAKNPAKEKTYLNVPYSEKNQAKKLGARWDKSAKCWFAPTGTDLEPLGKWLPKDKVIAPEKNAVQEFAKALQEAGLDLQGQLPIMDGTLQRVPVIDGKTNSRDGAYKGFLDGHPAGFIQNHKTGYKENWKAEGHELSEEQKAQLKAQAAQKKIDQEKALTQLREKASKRAFAKWANAKGWANAHQEYLAKKGVPGYGVKVNEQGDLLVPGRDVNGHIHTMQTINSDGKLFEKGGLKAGMFHTIDPEHKLGQSDKILISEGYATAASVHMATNEPTIVAFDASNLEPVAKVLKKKYPQSRIAILGDNDHHLANNVGVEKAHAAAKAVDGIAIVPKFTSAERRQGLSDFNDLHQSSGLEEVKTQLSGLFKQQEKSAQKQPAKAMAM